MDTFVSKKIRMETIYICILTLLGVFAIMLWLVFHFHRVQSDLEEGMRSIKRSQDNISARIMQLDEAQKKLQAAQAAKKETEVPAPAEKKDAETPVEKQEAKAPAPSKEALLTPAAVSGCMRAAGYVPEKREDGFAFTKEDETYLIDMSRNPQLFISKSYLLSAGDWDVELLQRAAHQMADEIIMIKADISDVVDEEGNRVLRFYVVMIERTVRGFRENLKDYIRIIDDGERRMRDLYHRLEDETKDAASLHGLANSAFRQNRNTPS